MIIPGGTGRISGILGRVIVPKLTKSLGQQVVADNRPGASGVVGSQLVAKAAPATVFPRHGRRNEAG